LKRELESVERFLKEIGIHNIMPQVKLAVSKANLPPTMQVVLLEYK
jgi:hypothetical protein